MCRPPLHVPICDLNCSIDVNSGSFCGREFHILAAVERKDLTQYVLVLTWGISTVFVYLKEYECGLYVQKSLKYKGVWLFKILNIADF